MVRKNEKNNYWHSLATFTSVRGIDLVRTQPGGGGQAIVTNYITVHLKGEGVKRLRGYQINVRPL